MSQNKKNQVFLVNGGDSQYLVFEKQSYNSGYPNNLKQIGVVSKDKKTKLWDIAPHKAIGSSKPKYKNRKVAITKLFSANNKPYQFVAGL